MAFVGWYWTVMGQSPRNIDCADDMADDSGADNDVADDSGVDNNMADSWADNDMADSRADNDMADSGGADSRS